MKRFVLLVASFVIALVAIVPNASASNNPYAFWQLSIDSFAQEHGLAAANWVILPADADAHSACGVIPAINSLFYCPTDDQAYINVGTADQYGITTHHLAPVIIMAHEFGHSLQWGVNPSLTNSRSTENGADCIAGAWLAWANHNGTVHVSLEDIPLLYALVDSLKGDGHGTHGTLFERAAAGANGYLRGLDYCGQYFVPIR